MVHAVLLRYGVFPRSTLNGLIKFLKLFGEKAVLLIVIPLSTVTIVAVLLFVIPLSTLIIVAVLLFVIPLSTLIISPTPAFWAGGGQHEPTFVSNV